MASKQQTVTVERDGINVEVDLSFMRSWRGIALASDMQSDRLDDVGKLSAMVEYYRGACPNIGDVDDALCEKAGEHVPADEVMKFVAEAVREATPKN